MPYNTISLNDRNGNEIIFDIMDITTEREALETINRGCELCKTYGSNTFQINYCVAGSSFGRSVIYSANGEKLDVEIWND